MIQLVIAVTLQTALFAAEADYATAYQATQETGKPLVVLVGADWCPGCRTMKQTVMPQLRQRGALAQVSYAEVNTDREGSLARDLMNRGAIPQLIVFHKGAEGWRRQVYVGPRSVGEIERIIQTAVDASQVAAQPVAQR